MQIQIGLALSVFKDPQPQKLLDHFVGNLSGICFGHADQYQKTFADAACYLSIYFYLCMLYPVVLQIAFVYFSPTFFSS